MPRSIGSEQSLTRSPVGNEASEVSIDGANLWVINFWSHNVSKLELDSRTELNRQAQGVLAQALAVQGDGAGYIFNLGHDVLLATRPKTFNVWWILFMNIPLREVDHVETGKYAIADGTHGA